MLEHRLLYELSFENDNRSLSHPLFGSKLEKEGKDLTLLPSVMVLESKSVAIHWRNGIWLKLSTSIQYPSG